MDTQPMMQDVHTSEMHDSNSPTVMAPKSILMGKDFKVGDEVMLKIKSMEGDNVELEYAPEEEAGEMSSEEMGKMSKDEAEKMPMEDMEKRLPKAKREY
jgi:hypothetical protein